jgi:mannose-1-phosphate guanylyltransferase / mannose-6-phosphate isomerase
MLNAGNYLWNAGIFICGVKDLVGTFEKYAPELIKPVSNSIKNGSSDLNFFRLNHIDWGDCKDISIDYAIMEKVKNLIVIPFSSGWSDLGGWNSVWEEMGPDKSGVVTSANANAIDCKNVLLRSESSSQEIVGFGLENIVAIAMPDAVLVANKDSVQDLKKVVKILKSKNIPQAEILLKDYRPWGWFETLASHDQFQVKRIHVNPGAALSLQSHKYRSEHWIVVIGTAKVIVGDIIKMVSEGESVHIPLGSIHRMENLGETPMVLIEVQTGTYLGEDDIIRFEDNYARS